jgi:hypothetical protein
LLPACPSVAGDDQPDDVRDIDALCGVNMYKSELCVKSMKFC